MLTSSPASVRTYLRTRLSSRRSTGGAALVVLLVTVAPRAMQPFTPSAAAASPRIDASGKVNVYAATAIGMMSPAASAALSRVYAPNVLGRSVSVIDPATNKVIQTIPTGEYPEHVVVGYDLRSLWIANTKGNTLTRIDPRTGVVDAPVPVADPYNVYWTPDGASMIVIAERYKRLDFLDARTLKLTASVPLKCAGANHVDYTADGKFALVSCEFSSQVFRLDVAARTVTGYLTLHAPTDTMRHITRSATRGRAPRTMRTSMPQDVRLTPDGSAFRVADMMADGLFVIAADSLAQIGFIPTGKGAHGIAVGRGGSPFYVANRGWHTVLGGRRGPGSVSVVDPNTRRVTATWPIPDGGSPDMGNVSADGKTVWFSGRYDDEIYALDTETGALRARIPVGRQPHGVAVWPIPGRYSLGHTGNMR